jgi:hypothetical protein
MKLSELQQVVFHHYYDKDTKTRGIHVQGGPTC